MHITFIDADSIYWEADRNIRYVDFERLLDRMEDKFHSDQIYFIGGLEPRDPFNGTMKEIIARAQTEKGLPIQPVSSIGRFDEKHTPECILIDLLYRGALSQKERGEHSFLIVSASLSSVRSAHFLAHNKIIQPVNYILSDTVHQDPAIQGKEIQICDTIPLAPNDRTAEDKIAMNAIIDIIRSNEEREIPFYNPMSILQNKLKKANNVKPYLARPLILSLIHNGVLARYKFIDQNGRTKTGIILGNVPLEQALKDTEMKALMGSSSEEA